MAKISKKTDEPHAEADGKGISAGAAIAFAIRDVLIFALSKGKIPTILAGIILIYTIVVWRLPAEELKQFNPQAMFALLEDWHILGWVLFVISLLFHGVFWMWHKTSVRTLLKEVRRNADEKNLWQKKGLGSELRSSREEDAEGQKS